LKPDNTATHSLAARGAAILIIRISVVAMTDIRAIEVRRLLQATHALDILDRSLCLSSWVLPVLLRGEIQRIV